MDENTPGNQTNEVPERTLKVGPKGQLANITLQLGWKGGLPLQASAEAGKGELSRNAPEPHFLFLNGPYDHPSPQDTK